MMPDAYDAHSGAGRTIPQQIGPYEIEKILGVGGMAVVYLGHKPELSERKVAIKAPSAALLTQGVINSFKKEAVAVANLSPDAIVSLYDYGVDNGRPYFAMRHMRGGSLADWLGERVLSLTEACGVIDRIAAALDHAHRRGIIHRDIKPGNILFDEDEDQERGEDENKARGKAYLSDFGIALSTDPDGAPSEAIRLDNPDATLSVVSDRSDTERTIGHLLIPGTPAYMSREALEGTFDRRSDVYALGVVLRQMLTGRSPSNPADVGSDAVTPVIQSDPLPPPVQAVIDRASAVNPDDRYQTAGALAFELRAAAAQIAAGQPADEPKPGPGPGPGPGRRPLPRGGLAAVIALVALALTLVVWGVWRDRRPSPGPTPIPAAIAAVTTAAVAATDTAIAANATVLAAAGTDVAEAIAAANTSEATANTAVAEAAATAAPALTAMAATDTPSPSSTAVTPTVTDTPTATPTSTSTATATSAPPTDTPVGPPTLPPPPAVVAQASLFTRSGPGMEYPTAGGGMRLGQVAPALAHDGDRRWYLLLLPSGRAFWAPASLLAPADGSSLEGVGPAATIPPPPTATPTPPPPPTATPTPGQNRPSQSPQPPATPAVTRPCTNPPYCGL